MTVVNVFGAGAFGTALAVVLAESRHDVTLIPRSEAHTEALIRDGENKSRLPGVRLPSSLTASDKPDDAGRICLMAVPAQALCEHAQMWAGFLEGRAAVACCKGVDLKSGTGPTAVLERVVPRVDAAILSGPGFAVDLASGLPTAMTIAARRKDQASELQNALSGKTLRLYRTTDVIGVEFGGALKNVVAIAAGAAIGAGLGESARAAVITRGFAEMSRFASHFGAEPATLTGLSGLGDLFLTATSEKSRNYSYGLGLGAGSPDKSGKTVEGVATSHVVSDMGKRAKIDMPVTDMVARLTKGDVTIGTAMSALMTRPLREE